MATPSYTLSAKDLYVSMPFLILLTSRDTSSRVFQPLVVSPTTVPLFAADKKSQALSAWQSHPSADQRRRVQD